MYRAMSVLLLLVLAGCPQKPTAVLAPPAESPTPAAPTPTTNAATGLLDIPVVGALRFATATFADQDGPFVIVGGGGQDERQLFDLRDGKFVATLSVPLKANSPPFALSPDGKYFASSETSPVVHVHEVASGTPVARITLTGSGADHLEFTGDHHLILSNKLGTVPVIVHDVANGREVVRIPMTSQHRRCAPAVSPDGKQLAVADAKAVVLYDLPAGKETARLVAPSKSSGLNPVPQGIAYSADGRQLATLVDEVGKFRFVVWDVAERKLSAEVPTEQFRYLPADDHRTLAWSADGEAFLLGGVVVVDRQTGRELWRVPQDTGGGRQPRRLVSPTAVLTLKSDETATPPCRVTSHGISKEQLAAVRGGAGPADALMPKAVAADWSAVKRIDAPPVGVAWAARVGAAPAEAPAPPTVALKILPDDVAQLWVAGAAAPRAVIEVGREIPGGTTFEDNRVRKYDVVEPASGGKRRLELPPGCRLVTVASDGATAVSLDANRTRLDVWDLAKAQHLFGFRPYEKEPEAGRKVVLARVLDGRALVTISASGQAVGWSVPAAKAEWTASLGDVRTAVLSPDGGHLFALASDAIRCLDAHTGQGVGDIKLSDPLPQRIGGDDSTFTPRLLVRPDGRQLAALVPSRVGLRRLQLWNLGDGSLEKTLDTPTLGPVTFAYTGPDHVLMSDGGLYDLKRGERVWTYYLPASAGRFASEQPGYRCWYAAADDKRTEVGLVAVDLPHDEVQSAARLVFGDAGVALPPGTKVAVRTKTSRPDKEAALRKAVDELLSRSKLVAAPDAPLTLDVAIEQRDTGEKVKLDKTYIDFSLKREIITNILEATVRAELLAGDKKIWESRRAENMLTPGYVIMVPEGTEDVVKYIHDKMWERAIDHGRLASLPRHAAATEAGPVWLPGQSMMGVRGVSPRLR